MKRILITIMVICAGTASLVAQSKVSKRDIQKATNEVATLYRLNDAQKQSVYEIEARRLENLAQVETIKNSYYDTYLRKRQAVRIGTENAIKRLLDEDQKKIYQEQVAARRQREVEKMRELKIQGASKEEIERAMLEIE